MWFNKNLQMDIIIDRIKNKDFSETAKRVLRFMIVHHCSIHHIEYKDKQKIEQKLGISSKKLLKIEHKHEN